MTRRFLFFTLATGLLALSLGGIETRAGTLADLLVPGATVEVKGNGFDFLFSGFSYGTTGSMPAAADVNFVTLIGSGSAGLEFQGGFGTPVGTTSDALLSYTVTSKLGAITDAHITGNPAVLGGAAAMAVTDTLYIPGTTTVVGQMTIFDIEPPPPGLKNSDQLTTGLNNQSLFVKKDIFAQSVTGVASLSFVDQTYSTPIAIPEPASLGLLGIGLSGLFTLRRFFKRASVA